jgi:hypothetical protein
MLMVKVFILVKPRLLLRFNLLQIQIGNRSVIHACERNTGVSGVGKVNAPSQLTLVVEESL